MSNKNGFTVIEMLIAITIIGLIAALVLIQVQNAKDDARVSNLLQLSSQTYHSLGYAIRSYQNFENNLTDDSGNGLGSGTGIDACCKFVNNTASPALGFSLDCCGDTPGVTLPIAQPREQKNELTIDAWIYPRTITGGDNTIAEKPSEFSFKVTPADKLSIKLYNSSGSTEYTPNEKIIQRNAWQYVAAIYDGKKIRLFFNGIEVGPGKNFSGDIPNTNNPFSSGVYFDGIIDDLRIFGKALELR